MYNWKGKQTGDECDLVAFLFCAGPRLGRLMLHFGIKLCADQDDNRG
jgi:hypothetical protein